MSYEYFKKLEEIAEISASRAASIMTDEERAKGQEKIFADLFGTSSLEKEKVDRLLSAYKFDEVVRKPFLDFPESIKVSDQEMTAPAHTPVYTPDDHPFETEAEARRHCYLVAQKKVVEAKMKFTCSPCVINHKGVPHNLLGMETFLLVNIHLNFDTEDKLGFQPTLFFKRLDAGALQGVILPLNRQLTKKVFGKELFTTDVLPALEAALKDMSPLLQAAAAKEASARYKDTPIKFGSW